MSSEADIWGEAMKLVDNAVRHHQKGEIDHCLKLMDQAIMLVENINVPSFSLRMERAVMGSGTPADFSKSIPVMFEAEKYYESKDLKMQQIKTLSDLASAISHYQKKHSEALKLIAKAETILDQIQHEFTNHKNSYYEFIYKEVHEVKLSIEDRIK